MAATKIYDSLECDGESHHVLKTVAYGQYAKTLECVVCGYEIFIEGDEW